MTEFVQLIYSNPLYLGVAVLVAIITIIIYARRTKDSTKPRRKVDSDIGKASEESAEPFTPDIQPILTETILMQSDSKEVNALVHDIQNRSFGPRYVALLPGKKYGRQWHYGNFLVYWLSLGLDSQLSPIVPPETLAHSPAELYEALQTKDDTYEVLGPQKTGLDKMKIGLLIALAIVALFLMYLKATA